MPRPRPPQRPTRWRMFWLVFVCLWLRPCPIRNDPSQDKEGDRLAFQQVFFLKADCRSIPTSQCSSHQYALAMTQPVAHHINEKVSFTTWPRVPAELGPCWLPKTDSAKELLGLSVDEMPCGALVRNQIANDGIWNMDRKHAFRVTAHMVGREIECQSVHRQCE